MQSICIDDRSNQVEGESSDQNENLLSLKNKNTEYPSRELPQANDVSIDVEEELDGPNVEKIEGPFNPEEIKINTTNITVWQVVLRIEHNEIELSPEWQRNSGIWDAVQQSRLIESLLLRIPIPVFYVAADNQENWAVVDGIQRISTINDFVGNKFKLKSLEYLNRFDGNLYDHLPRPMQRRIEETQLIVNVIDSRTPITVMFNIFKRINTGGMMLNGQEIRHALNPGQVRNYLKELADSEEFKLATDNSVRPKRMVDRECVLRFLAFYFNGWENYKENGLDSFLVNTMRQVNQMRESDLELPKRKFFDSMTAARRIFDDRAFRKPKPDNSRSPISKPLFEVWSVCLAKCSSQEITALIERRESVGDKFKDLVLRDDEFDRAISYSTGLSRRVRKRFESIQSLIHEIVSS